MATKKADTSAEALNILAVERTTMRFCVLGTTPMIMNRMSQKVWHELLAPKGRKTAADKAANLKHRPLDEYRASPYTIDDKKSDALMAVLPTAFKKAMGTAALDMPGAKKAQILRLCYIEGQMVEVYGVPRVFMAITRSADMNHTPDVRTRAILPEWACKVEVTFPESILRRQSISNLLAAAGFQSGIGDWRQEKGSGSYGCFALVSPDDPNWKRIVKEQGRKAQQEALDNPVAYNSETDEMLAWFEAEIKQRGAPKLKVA